MRRTLWRALVTAPLVLILVLPAPAFSRTIDEDRALAGFLMNCAMFVEWPTARSGSFTIGVAGADQVAAVVSEVDGRTIRGNALRVRKVKRAEEVPGVDVLYVGADARNTDALVAHSGTVPVLTISDAPQFTARGGIIRLYTDDGKLRFEINTTAAERAGLKISAKMLGLAKIVR